MDRRQFLELGGAALLASASAGCSSVGGAADSVGVSMTGGFAFDPARLRVKTGTTVEWVNDSDVGHTVTAYEDRIPSGAVYFASGGFESERAARNDVGGGLLQSGESFAHTFDVAGTYEYYCIPHEGSRMVGTVVVE